MAGSSSGRPAFGAPRQVARGRVEEAGAQLGSAMGAAAKQRPRCGRSAVAAGGQLRRSSRRARDDAGPPKAQPGGSEASGHFAQPRKRVPRIWSRARARPVGHAQAERLAVEGEHLGPPRQLGAHRSRPRGAQQGQRPFRRSSEQLRGRHARRRRAPSARRYSYAILRHGQGGRTRAPAPFDAVSRCRASSSAPAAIRRLTDCSRCGVGAQMPSATLRTRRRRGPARATGLSSRAAGPVRGRLDDAEPGPHAPARRRRPRPRTRAARGPRATSAKIEAVLAELRALRSGGGRQEQLLLLPVRARRRAPEPLGGRPR